MFAYEWASALLEHQVGGEAEAEKKGEWNEGVGVPGLGNLECLYSHWQCVQICVVYKSLVDYIFLMLVCKIIDIYQYSNGLLLKFIK